MITIMRKTGLLTMLAGPMFLSGCLGMGNPEYGCSGLPEGVSCASSREIYGMTEQPGPVRMDPMSNDEARSHDHHETSGDNERSHSSARYSNGHPMAAASVNRDPVPIRTDAKIMRIWVAPWESTNGDLNVSGLVFTELENRRWNIASEVEVQSPRLTPLQTIKRSLEKDEQQ